MTETPEALIGPMATVMLPVRAGTTRAAAMGLRDALLFDDGIEAHVHLYRDRVQARISAQIYNEMADIDRLAEAVLRHVA